MLLLLYIVSMFLPGYLVYIAISGNRPNFLTMFALSLSLLMLNLIMFEQLGVSITRYPFVIAFQILGFGLASCVRLLYHRSSPPPSLDRSHILPLSMITIGVILYVSYAGIYTEVPADVWRHLGYTQRALIGVENNYIVTEPTMWFVLPAMMRSMTTTGITKFISEYGSISVLVYCIGSYWFFFQIIVKTNSNKRVAAITAILAVAFSAMSIGVDTFAYIRYYIFAPTFQNILVYFCCLLLVIRIFETGKITITDVTLLILFSVSMYFVHTQEFVFLVASTLSLSAVVVLKTLVTRSLWGSVPFGFKNSAVSIHPLWLALLVITSILLLFLYSRYNLSPQSALSPWIIPVSTFFSFGDHLYIADPRGQFFGAVTTWGVFVYILFVLNFRIFRNNLYILSGMLVPLVTLFNPLFVDLFVRHNEASPIYRFVYIIPLGLVGSMLTVKWIKEVRFEKIPRKITSLLSLLLLIGLLMPYQFTYLQNSQSKLHTLIPVAEANNYTHWSDLLEYLSDSDSSTVITDPVTAYMVRGFTSKSSPGYKFHKSFIDLDLIQDMWPMYVGAYLVINRRDGDPSTTGQRSGHWGKDVLKLSQYYPRQLISFIEKNPRIFDPIWASGQIRVYEIVDSPDDAD